MRNKILPLMQREWLQHRFAWALMTLVPLALGVLLTAFGTVQIDEETVENAGPALPALMAMAAFGASIALMFIIAAVASTITIAGLARRDHGDRSIEFWLSVPAGHAQSLAVPMFVHLLLVPMAALVVGLVGGSLVSLLLVSRVDSAAAWFGLPWLELLPALLAMTLRVLAGVPLALLWLLPLVMLTVLLTAWLRRWGLVVMIAGVGLGSVLLNQVFGQAWALNALQTIFVNGTHALIYGSDDGSFVVKDAGDGMEALRRLPSWALSDYGHSLSDLASLALPGGLLVAGLCFWLLVLWRQRGAGAAG